MSEYCTCNTYTGTERNAAGERVCERCGKVDDATAEAHRILNLVWSEPGDPIHDKFFAEGYPSVTDDHA